MSQRWAAIARYAPIVLALVACGGEPAPVVPPAARPLEFINDDWPRALAEAKRRSVPVFVEAWAPW